jgi:hypothetical protein
VLHDTTCFDLSISTREAASEAAKRIDCKAKRHRTLTQAGMNTVTLPAVRGKLLNAWSPLPAGRGTGLGDQTGCEGISKANASIFRCLDETFSLVDTKMAAVL